MNENSICESHEYQHQNALYQKTTKPNSFYSHDLPVQEMMTPTPEQLHLQLQNILSVQFISHG
jgi:hypothetical protein